jgi:hypothetical protein
LTAQNSASKKQNKNGGAQPVHLAGSLNQMPSEVPRGFARFRLPLVVLHFRLYNTRSVG